MIDNTIICHSFPAWDTPYVKSTIELMTRLTKENRVIFVDYHYTLKDLFTNKYAPKKRLLGLKSRWRNIKTDTGLIEVYTAPPVLPTNWINNQVLLNLVTHVNRFILKGAVKSVMRNVGHTEATMINAFNPAFGLLTKKYWKVKQSLYYCYDEISGTSWAGKYGPTYETQYAKEVDGIICTSSHLKQQKAKLNPNCHLVPNGVNLDIFQAQAPNKNTNQAIGYVGAIDNRIDFELIQALAKDMDNYDFHFYGPVKTTLPSMPANVHFHGAIPQEHLPLKVNKLDACLIPFVKNELTAAIYPLKINEYLALGKPVISTDFADLSDFTKLISVGKDSAAFIDQIKKELLYNNRLKAQKRIKFAKGNSWDHRAAEFNLLIRQTNLAYS